MDEETVSVLPNEKRGLQQLFGSDEVLYRKQELTEILSKTLQGVQSLGFDRVRLYLLSTDRQSLVGYAHVGMETPFEGIKFQVATDESMQRLLTFPRPQLLMRKAYEPTSIAQLLDGVEQWVSIPLLFQEKITGILLVDNKFSRRPISETELDTLALLANQVAIVLEYAQHFAEIKRHTEQLEKLHHATLAFTAQLEQDKLLDTIVSKAATLLGAKGSCIYEYAPATQTLYSMATYGLPAALQGHTLSVGEGMAGMLVQEGEPWMIVDDYEQWTGQDEIYAGKGNFGAVVNVLLKWRNQPIGVLCVNDNVGRKFTTEDAKLLQLFANYTAIVLDNAQLYQGAQKQAVALEAVYNAGRAVTSSLNLDEILHRITEQAVHLTGCDEKKGGFAIISLVEGNKSKFVTSHPHTALQKVHNVLGEEVDITKDEDNRIGIIGRAIKTVQPQLVSDVTKNKDYLEAYQETRTELAVPIVIDGHVLGAINVEHPTPNAFDHEHQRALESLAVQAAIAIRNAQRFEELKRIKGYIGTKTAVEWIQMVSTAWGHSVRREVGTARGHIALLERLLRQETKRPEALEELKQLTAVISDIGEIPIIAPLSYEDAVASVQVNKLVQTYLTRLWKLAPYKEVALQFSLQTDLDTQATVWVSPEWLRRVFEIVVDNAVYAMLRANPSLQPKQLQVITKLAGDAIIIAFADTGPGIPPQVMAKLFENPIDKPAGSRGAGIGMMLAKTIMQTYRGDITVQATGSDGTQIAITLPVEESVNF